MPGPLDLDDDDAYQRWRQRKLDTAPRRIEDIIAPIDDPRRLSAAEQRRLIELNAVCNMSIYASACGEDDDKEIVRALGRKMGLHSLDDHWLTDSDGVSPLSVSGADERRERGDFIPYTDRPIKWHTDGYYNEPQRRVCAIILHCVRSAVSGGDNQLLDHEMAYIVLRDENPDHIRALSRHDVLTIPARLDDNGAVLREARSGPVFSPNADGSLHMRYTARRISVLWRNDAATRAAVAALERLLAAPAPWALRGRLEPGMGLLCNNVLHDRSGFDESEQRRRLLYRARYHERVTSSRQE